MNLQAYGIKSEKQISKERINQKPLILVVEDNIAMNHFICSTLEPKYRCINAFNGNEV